MTKRHGPDVRTVLLPLPKALHRAVKTRAKSLRRTLVGHIEVVLREHHVVIDRAVELSALAQRVAALEKHGLECGSLAPDDDARCILPLGHREHPDTQHPNLGVLCRGKDGLAWPLKEARLDR